MKNMYDYELLGNNNVYVYPYDFLDSGDITHYYNWRDSVPVLKKENRFFYADSLSKNLKDITSCTEKNEEFLSDIPEQTYLTWETTPCSQRQGFALLCFLGKWYIARRQELPPYMGCVREEKCRLEHLVKISKEEKYKDFRFLFSFVDRTVSWPPQKTRIWILHPEGTYKREMFIMDDQFWDIDKDVYSLDCPREKNECGKLAL